MVRAALVLVGLDVAVYVALSRPLAGLEAAAWNRLSAVRHSAQETQVRVARLDPGASVRHAFAPGRHGYVQVAKGAVTLNGHPLAAGDGAALSGEAEAMLVAAEASEVLLFDLA